MGFDKKHMSFFQLEALALFLVSNVNGFLLILMLLTGMHWLAQRI